MSLGHESTGVVVSIGSEVSSLEIGDAVALEVGLPCGSCNRCDEGRYNICSAMRFRSSAKAFPHAQGTLQDRINHPAAWCHKLPQNISFGLGAILEPLSVTVHATRRANLPPEAKIIVIGAGAIGLLTAAVCKIHGATVLIADIDAGRVNFAVENRFADHAFVIPIRKTSGIDDELMAAKALATEFVQVQTAGASLFGDVDTVFECTGVPFCAQTAIYVGHLIPPAMRCVSSLTKFRRHVLEAMLYWSVWETRCTPCLFLLRHYVKWTYWARFATPTHILERSKY